ncbi:MAG: hypothetical protein R3217_04965 [Gammaproteobacteria bacterium]|nr:hypothetical protein [Gammaproteobacteria bacterium]
MSANDFLTITPVPLLSIAIWLLLGMVFLYFAREPARAGLLQLGNSLYRACRLAAHGLASAESRMAARNREVLLSQGREAAERAIEREFERIEHSVRKELGDYPALHRQVSEAITAIEEDYQNSREVPPAPPGWVDAVDAVARIPKADAMVGKVLDDIHVSMKKAEKRATNEYRKDARQRHRLLSKARPHWRALVDRLAGAESKLQRLLDRASSIDNHMGEYKEITRGDDAALRRLSSSSLTQFFVAAFVLAIAVGGAIINFNLIARPMSEMVGGTGMVAGLKVADIAALVIILVEISMGLFLMESLRITRLFPVISALEDRTRRRMIWISLTILTILASVEAGLAFMREILVQDELATSAMLRGDAAAATEPRFMWITTAAQMGMGFILPFALTFVAIPLETFVNSLRTVLGMIGGFLLRAIATVFRIVGNVSRGVGRFLASFYDVLVFLPLWIENVVRQRNGQASSSRLSSREA